MEISTYCRPQKRILKKALLAGGVLAVGCLSAKAIVSKKKNSEPSIEKWLKASFDQLQTKLSVPFRTSVEVFEVLKDSTHKMIKLTKKTAHAEADELGDLREDIESEFHHMKRKIHKILNPSNGMTEILEKYYQDLRERLFNR